MAPSVLGIGVGATLSVYVPAVIPAPPEHQRNVLIRFDGLAMRCSRRGPRPDVTRFQRDEVVAGAIGAKPVRTFFGTEYGRLSREANSLYLEFSDYVERVENSLKFVGGFYLATIFRSAAGRFHLRDWEESVTRKLNTLAQISELLEGEINVRRSHWLEIVVILLILYEIVAAALRFT